MTAVLLLPRFATRPTVDTVVAAVAVVDVAIAVGAQRLLATPNAVHGDWRRHVSWRTLGLFSLVERLAFAYLRADAIVVARLVGSGPGATYNLIYRIVDAV